MTDARSLADLDRGEVFEFSCDRYRHSAQDMGAMLIDAVATDDREAWDWLWNSPEGLRWEGQAPKHLTELGWRWIAEGLLIKDRRPDPPASIFLSPNYVPLPRHRGFIITYVDLVGDSMRWAHERWAVVGSLTWWSVDEFRLRPDGTIAPRWNYRDIETKQRFEKEARIKALNTQGLHP